MNRPRDSILVLFDPLNVALPLSPRSDVTSPDSDKENATPDRAALSNEQLTMTTFFNRTCTRKPSYSGPPPLTPRGRLVDLSMDDGPSVDALTGLVADEEEQEADSCHLLVQRSPEDQGNASRDEDDTISLAVATANFATPRKGELCTPMVTPRTPLAEIPFKIKITSIPRKKLYRRAASPSRDDTTATRLPAAHPQESSLSAVVYNVSISGVPFAHPHPLVISEKLVPQEEATHGERFSQDKTLQIVIAPPPEDDHCRGSVPSRAKFSNSRFLRPRSQTTNTSVNANRSSVDLHASFNLQIQCPEASFDLLNDKISFLGMDKSLSEEDDDQSDDTTKAEEMENHDPVKVDDGKVRHASPPDVLSIQSNSNDIRRPHLPPPETVDACPPTRSCEDWRVVTPVLAMPNEPTKPSLLLAQKYELPEGVFCVEEIIPTQETRSAASVSQAFPHPVFIPPPEDPCTPVYPSRKKFRLPPLFAQPSSPGRAQDPIHVSALRIVKRKPGRGEKVTSVGVKGKPASDLEPTITLSTVALKQQPIMPRRLARRTSVAPPSLALTQRRPTAISEAEVAVPGGGGPQRLMTTTTSHQAAPGSQFGVVNNNRLAADRLSSIESGKSGIPGPRRVPAPPSMAAVVTRRKGAGGTGGGLAAVSKNGRGPGAGAALVSALPKPVSRLPARRVRK